MAVKPTNQAQPSPVSAYLTNTRLPDRTPVRPITTTAPITAPPPALKASAQKPPTQIERAQIKPAQIEPEKHEGQSAALEIMSFYKRPSDKAASARPSAIGRRLDVVG